MNGVCRAQKFKGGSDAAGLNIHDDRKKESFSNPDIDKSRTHLNYNLKDCPNYNKAIDKRIKSGFKGERGVRSDAVKMVGIMFTASNDFFRGLSAEKTREYFEHCYYWALERYGAENVIGAKVHMDEKTPHMHFYFVPLTPDGRLSAKEILGEKKGLQQLQDDFYNQVSKKYGLSRGERTDLDNPESKKPKKHEPTKKFKERTAFELEKEINRLETKLEDKTEELNKKNDDLGDVEAKIIQGEAVLNSQQEQFKTIRKMIENEEQALKQAKNTSEMEIKAIREEIVKEKQIAEKEIVNIKETQALNVEDVYRESQEHIDRVNSYIEAASSLDAFKPPKTTPLDEKDKKKIGIKTNADLLVIGENSFNNMVNKIEQTIAIKADLSNREDTLEKRSNEIDEKEKAVSKREAVADQREEKIKTAVNNLEVREKKITAKEKIYNSLPEPIPSKIIPFWDEMVAKVKAVPEMIKQGIEQGIAKWKGEHNQLVEDFGHMKNRAEKAEKMAESVIAELFESGKQKGQLNVNVIVAAVSKYDSDSGVALGRAIHRTHEQIR